MPNTPPPPLPDAARRPAFVLRLDAVTVARHGATVLEGATLSLRAGEALVVDGAPGAGTSTLLAVCACALRPQTGTVIIGDKVVAELQASAWPLLRRSIGYATDADPAWAQLCDDETARENVAWGAAVTRRPVRAAVHAAERMLERLGASGVAQRRVGTLAPRERRTVGVARALVSGAALLVLDEPVDAFDERAAEKLSVVLAEARAAGAAVLCASRSATLLRGLEGAERVRLEDGRVRGTAPRLTLVPPVLRAVAPPLRTDADADEELQSADLLEEETA